MLVGVKGVKEPIAKKLGKRKGEISKLPRAIKRTLVNEIALGEDDMMTYNRQQQPF
jgi:hypothetical protein